MVPRVVPAHAGNLKRSPTAWVLEDRQSALQGCKQRHSSVLREHKSRRGHSFWSEVSNRIGKPADLVDDWNRAVPQAVHLVQSARLEPRRHEEDVGAAFDEVSELLAEIDADANPVWVTGGKSGPEV